MTETYEPLDPDYLGRILGEGFYPIVDYYFRAKLLGAHKLPTEGPLILAANHSGTAFPYDAMVLDTMLWRRDGFRVEAKFRSVYEKILSFHWWMRPYGLDNFYRRGGGVDLTFDNFDRLLARGERVAYYPEGVAGIGKGFRRRYQLQPFSTSFVILAARHKAPVFPVHIINAEWVIPFNVTFPPLNWVMSKFFGVPFLPLPGALFAITFPWAWYLACPARMTLVVGEPIDMAALVEAEGVTDLENPDRATMKRISEKVRLQVQAELDSKVKKYGRRPYQLRSFRKAISKARKKKLASRMIPFTWPVTFVKLDRDLRRPPARNRFHAILRDLDLVAFYLPFGWPMLSLFRILRRQPYGFRGMSRAEGRTQEGRFVWHLKDRPLPDKRG